MRNKGLITFLLGMSWGMILIGTFFIPTINLLLGLIVIMIWTIVVIIELNKEDALKGEGEDGNSRTYV